MELCARETEGKVLTTPNMHQTNATLHFRARTAYPPEAKQNKLFMQRNLQEDLNEAKSKIGESVMLAGVEIKRLELQALKSIVPGTSTKRKYPYFKWKFQLVGAKKTFWQHITYDVYIDFHHRHPFTRKFFYTVKTTT